MLVFHSKAPAASSMLEKGPDIPRGPLSRQSSQILPDPFVFVPVTGKEARRGRGAANRLVRAHVTRFQHAKSGTLRSSQDLQDWTVRPYIHRKTPLPIRPRAKRGDDMAKAGSEEEADDEEREEARKMGMGIMKIVHRLPTGSAHDDPFWTYPVEYQPALSPIFAHCEWRIPRAKAQSSNFANAHFFPQTSKTSR